ncbi:sce7725 family protein [Shouchella clausii]|uniref:sce7725 family protein n=1 Tax=Shouchella clausii TaxID=79880 RepID=UPI0026FDF558|nr:sce7725 family protein [Shouchella clausii]MDO7266245.1 sce7725 family protein [Shouchella clausii]MDO7286840.1 sce7725 family protein [Shouchella clausii]
MYFPYVRGRQYELIALRELVEKGLIGKKIVPIIEPIKPSTTLFKTLHAYCMSEREIAFIHNPKVGDYKKEFNNLNNEKVHDDFIKVLSNHYLINAFLISNYGIESLSNSGIREKDNNSIMIIFDNQDSSLINEYSRWFNKDTPSFNLIPDGTSIRRRIKHNKVLFDDKFSRQPKNSDYLEVGDSYFSEDHLFFKEEGYLGFSDYSIVGATYSEGGFAPYAVAIHITYFDSNGILRVRHFVSNSNNDYRDPAGKFSQALGKLISWQSERKLETYAMKEFEDHHQKGTYPGLGPIKKLCLMHHIELVNNYLEKED